MLKQFPTEHWCMADFGKQLAILRKARHLTQLQLAELIGIQPRLIGRWEQGKGKPQFDHLIKLAEVLEVSLDRLVHGGDTLSPDQFEIKNKQLKELCKKVDQLKPEDQSVVCHFLEMAVRTDQLKRIMIDPLSQRS